MSRIVGRMCEGKQRYVSAELARAAVKSMIHNGKTERGNRTQLAPYRCPICDTYHIGHQPRTKGHVVRRKQRYAK